MCIKCEEFADIKICDSEEMYIVADSLKDAIERGDIVEIKKNIDEFHPRQVSIYEIERDKFWPDDFIEIYFQCVHCKNEIKLSCETYHGSGGHVEIIEKGFLKAILSNLGIS